MKWLRDCQAAPSTARAARNFPGACPGGLHICCGIPVVVPEGVPEEVSGEDIEEVPEEVSMGVPAEISARKFCISHVFSDSGIEL